MSSGTVFIIAREFGKALLPLRQALSSPEEFSGFASKLGWEISNVPVPLLSLLSQLLALEQALEQVAGTEDPTPQQLDDLISSLENLFTAIEALQSAGGFDPALLAEGFNTEFPKQLISFLLIDYLGINQTRIFTLLKALGIVKIKYRPALGTRPSFMSYSLDFKDIPRLFSDPVLLFENAYGWRTDDLNYSEINSSILQITRAAKIPSYQETLDESIAKALNNITEPGKPIRWALNIPFFAMGSPAGEVSSGLIIYGLPKTASLKPGLAIIPYTKGSVSKSLEVTEKLFFTIQTSLNIEGGLALTIRPGEIKVITGFNDPTVSELHGELRFGLENRTRTGEPIIVLGTADASRLQYQSLSVTVGMSVQAGAKPNVFIEAALNSAKLVVKAGDGDNFLKKILPPDGFALDFDTTVGLSAIHGFYFSGSGGLEINIPAHIQIGPVSLEGLTIAAKPKNDTLPVELGANIKVQLGPLTGIVQNTGLSATFSFPEDGSGNLGKLHLKLGFKPPNGVGLSIDAGGLKGGGFLRLDPDKGEYFGALELEFKNLFTLKAFGIINTIMPDGSKDFSMLVIITAEFTPIQLGFGFTLNGVGGLLGVNRTVKLDVLREGLKTNTLKSILFPEDVIGNITRIISDIKQVFPPQSGRYLIGPMGKIGWGTPSILTLELGILIEIPVPRIAILGVLKALLPEENAPLLRLQINFLGVIDFENKYISFDASLYDSRLLLYTLTGDMAFRLSWGDNPLFILSVGGFHPSFKDAPADLQSMRRLTISLLSGGIARITVQNYFAITSNTAQFGARAELLAGKETGFNIYGFIGFDVLFQFDPFKFIADFAAGIALRRKSSVYMSINVSGQLSGPSPWDAKGEASVDFFFFSISISFHETWGDSSSAVEPEKADLLDLLRKEINDDRNWKAVIPVNNNIHVSIKELPAGKLVIHPFGILTFSERLIPLDVDIQKFGTRLPKDANNFKIISTSADLKTEPVKEQFAPANFFELKDADKLSSPSFEPMNSGFAISGSSAFKMAEQAVDKPVDYEFSYLRKKKYTVQKVGAYKFDKALFRTAAKGAAITKSNLSHVANRLSANAPEKLLQEKEQFAIANNSNLKLHKENLIAGSYTEALQMYNQLIKEQPELKKEIQIISRFELNQEV